MAGVVLHSLEHRAGYGSSHAIEQQL